MNHVEEAINKLAQRSARSNTGCLEWTAGCDWDGYGIVKIGGRSRRANRVAWELAHGKTVPPKLVVRHTCDNPPCIEPEHLLLGTVAENNRDREQRGRSADRRADKCPTAKLTWESVREIRRLAAKQLPHGVIAAQFGVTRSAVSLITRNERWKEPA